MLGCRSIALRLLSFVAPLVCTGMAAMVAEAQAPPSTGLHWTRSEGAEDCLDGTDLAQRVASRMGHPVFVAPAAAELFVEGRVRTRPAGGFAATLVLLKDDGTEVGARELASDADDCSELSDTAVLVLAVMLDPDAVAEPSSAEASAEAAEEEKNANEGSPAADAAEPSITPPAEATRESKGPQRNTIEGLARVATHTLPQPAFGGGVAYTRTFPRRVRLRMEAVAYNEQTRTLKDTNPARGVTLQPLLAGAGICPTAWTWRKLGSSLCATVQVGAVIFRGLRLEDPQDDRFLLVQGALGARLWWEHDWIHLSVGASLVAAIKADGLDVTRTNGTRIPLVKVGALSADVDAAFGVRF